MPVLQRNQPELSAASQRFSHPLPLLIGFWVSVFIAIGVVIRRLVQLAHPAPGGNSLLDGLDQTFASHAVLTRAHIIPAAIFVIVAVIVLLRPKHSDSLQRIFFLFGLITGMTAYAMSAYAFGGWIERSAVLVFNTWFLFCMGRAFWFHIHDDAARERDWTTRAVGVLLGIATTRPVMGVFFATSMLTHLTPKQFFGAAFWIGFSINAVVVELWLRSEWRARAQLRSQGHA